MGHAVAMHAGAARCVVEEGMPGCEMSVVYAGVAFAVHTQQGSPSSRPFVWPSLSASRQQKVAFQPNLFTWGGGVWGGGTVGR